jgi:hypothetical protein
MMHLADYTSPAAAAEGPQSFLMSDYRPERRRHARRRLRVDAEARRLDNTLAAQRSPRMTLSILDVSEGGISAMSKSPVLAGERLAVLMPPGSGLPSRIFGKVVRCEPRADRWFLAIRFDSIPAA